MPSKQIVDSRLFIRLDLSNAHLVNKSFANNTHNKAHFASQLLLYEKIVIPTTDFGIVPIFISWLGQENFITALNSGVFLFISRNSMLAYNGGLGIGLIQIEKGNREFVPWWQEELFCDDEKAIGIQLENNLPSISKHQQKIIIQKVLESTNHLSFEGDLFTKYVVEESYKDIISSPLLNNLVKRYGKKRPDGTIHLEKLEEIPSNQTRVLSQDGILKDTADLVLRVAEINMELIMATQTDNADLFTSHGAENILRQKLNRVKFPQELSNGFSRLLDLTNVPDLRLAVASGSLELAEIWRIRRSASGKKFRNWLRQANTRCARDLEKAYVEAIGNSTLADSFPLRSIRFAITSLAGLINPAIGLGIDIVDNFFIENWLKGFSPKLFFDDLQYLTIKKKNSNQR